MDLVWKAILREVPKSEREGVLLPHLFDIQPDCWTINLKALNTFLKELKLGSEIPSVVVRDRYKREERRREELYRQYYDDLQKKAEQDRRVECSVVVANKQSKEYAESVGRKVRDLGMLVDLIFLNTDVSLSQVLEDVTRGGTPFAIVISPQHQTHHSCTVNILFGTPQEHRNMPLADAMVLVARSYERYKVEKT
ncbi:unnamed protein product [Ranitomeya imitator]|uniref:Uncharacterized protein n=1 Tax=Ranitomeya imitator TaxID=111125 RepID=A0ABN9MF35_9NEOB|nr:unnamed protein product [Ranitomeya imitator]